MRLRLNERTLKYSEQLWNPDKDTCCHDNLMFMVTPARKVTPSCSWSAPSPGPGSGLPVDQHLSQSPDHLSDRPAVTTCSIKWLKTQGP